MVSKRHRKQRKSSAPPVTVPPKNAAVKFSHDRISVSDLFVVLGAILASFIAYANSVPGEFVYDDVKEIVGNQLIQDSRFFGQALVSDVWAFKGDTDQAWSNYWRPTFVLWLIANNFLFGVQDPTGWHLGSLLLHGLVIALGYGILRYLGLTRAIAGVITFIFAIHPVHVESVAWISGSVDLLMASAFLGALWLALTALERPDWRKTAAALMLLAVALLAKEVAIVFPVVIFVAALDATRQESLSWQSCLGRSIRIVLPYFVLALVYFLVRILVLGQFAKTGTTDLPIGSVILTAPSVLGFYLRQLVFPLWMGPSYPIRAVTGSGMTVGNFWVPLLVSATAAVLTVWAMRNGKVQRIGAALLILPLLPTLNINAFIPEQLVHDRYLYLPLLGFLMLVVPSLVTWIGVVIKRDSAITRLAGYVAVVVCCLMLGAQTVSYNRAWLSDLALWERGVKTDPNSAFNWTQYGNALLAADREAEASRAFNRSLVSMTASSTPNALLSRAQIAIDQGRLGDAERDLRLVLAGMPENVQAYEQLAVIYQQSGRLNDAANVLASGRERVPYHYCAFTNNLAVVLYLGGSKGQALSELESVRSMALRQISSGCRVSLFRLGQLYLEVGREAEGKAVLQEYLTISATMHDDSTRKYRAIALDLLEQ